MGTAKVKSGSAAGKVQYPYDAMVYIDGTSVIAVDSEGNTIKRGVAGTDDASVIQSAVGFISSGKILLCGEFVTTASIILHSNILLEFNGPKTGVTLADGLNNVNIIQNYNTPGPDTNIHIIGNGGYINGNNLHVTGLSNGIKISNCSNITIDGLNVNNVKYNGIFTSAECSNVEVTNCYVYNCLGHSIIFAQTDNCIMSNNRINCPSGLYCLYMVDVTDGTINGNVVNLGNKGIVVENGSSHNSDGVSITGNVIDGCSWGFHLESAYAGFETRNIIIDGNVFKNCNSYGGVIVGSYVNYVTVNSNTIMDVAINYGLEIDCGIGHIISNNIFKEIGVSTGGGRAAIYVNKTGSGYITISGNTMMTFSSPQRLYYGILVKCDDATITGNYVYNAYVSGIFNQGGQRVSITGNTCYTAGTGNYAIDSTGNNCVIVGNVCVGSVGFYYYALHLGGDGVVAQSNIISGMGEYKNFDIVNSATNVILKDNIGYINIPSLRCEINSFLETLGDTRLLLPCIDRNGTSVTDYSKYSKILTTSDLGLRHATYCNSAYFMFDGTVGNRIYLSNDTDFDFGNSLTDNAFSIVCCVYADAVDSRQIIGKWDENNLREWRFFLDASGYPTIQLYDESVDKYIGRQDQTALVTTGWKVLVTTYDGSGICAGCKVYLDGVQVDDADYTDAGYVAMEAINTNLMIGALKNAAAYSEYFDGKMTWIGVTAKELSPDEVWSLTQRLKGALGI